MLTLILTALYLEERHKLKAKLPAGRMTQFWDGAERRRFVRINADVPIRYNLPKEPNNEKVIKTKNISIGGVCISLKEKLTPRERLSLEIECPTFPHHPVVAKGEVIWVREETQKEGIRYFDTGIEFKDILPKDKERLFKFIKEVGQIQSG